MSHNSICQCGDCFAKKLNPQTTVPIGVGYLPGSTWDPPPEEEVFAESAPIDLPLIPSGADPQLPWPGQPGLIVDETLPAHVAGMEIIGAIVIKDGTTHALVLWDGTHQHMIYWERNATTHGRGEWAIVRL